MVMLREDDCCYGSELRTEKATLAPVKVNAHKLERELVTAARLKGRKSTSKSS